MAIRALDAYKRSLTGYGLVRPLRRLGSNDFIAASGETQVRSCIDQILGTKQNELPWRPNFGLNIERYRHANLSPAKAMKLGDEIGTAVVTFEPRALVQQANASKNPQDNKINAKLRWTLRSDRSASGVLLPPVTQEVSI